MKIAFFPLFHHYYSIELANGLSKISGNEIYYISRKKYAEFNNSHLEYKSFLGDNLNPLVTKKFVDYYRLIDPRNFFTIRNMKKYVLDCNPDVLHLHANTDPRMLKLVKSVKNIPIIVTVHDSKPRSGEIWDSKKISAFQALFNLANHFIVHGHKQKVILAKNFNISVDKISVIPHGVISLFNKGTNKPKVEDNTILFFGRISRYKGLEYLIKAEPLISREISNLKIIIAGSPVSGESMDRYRSLIKDKNKFEILEKYIPADEVSSLFNRSKFVVLPYLDATQSGVIPLSYSFGKPVVATDVGSISELVKNGETGVLIPPKNERILAKEIINLLQNKNLVDKMGSEARKMVKSDISWDTICIKTMKAYGKVTESFFEK